jgi:HNH endonuclease
MSNCKLAQIRTTAMDLPKAPQRTTPGFAFSIVNRALLDCIADRQFGKPEMAEVVAFFGEDPPSCVYCGGRPIKRWDHLTAVSKGGDTRLGNIVPACAKCDDSKADSPFDAWALGSAPNSPRTRCVDDIERRLHKIRDYVAEYSYKPRSPEERLSLDELQQFELLRADLQRIHGEFDAFITRYRQRTGLR